MRNDLNSDLVGIHGTPTRCLNDDDMLGMKEEPEEDQTSNGKNVKRNGRGIGTFTAEKHLG
jgi:hypothetical protein